MQDMVISLATSCCTDKHESSLTVHVTCIRACCACAASMASSGSCTRVVALTGRVAAFAGSRCRRGYRNSADTCGEGGQPEAPYHPVCLFSSWLCHELPVLLHWPHGPQVGSIMLLLLLASFSCVHTMHVAARCYDRQHANKVVLSHT